MNEFSNSRLVRFLVNSAAALCMAVGLATWGGTQVHGPTFPPDPWGGKVAHGPTVSHVTWDGQKA
jgi:hypothetical protein